MAGFGLGFGAFAAGLTSGVNAGIKLGNAWQAKKERDAKQDAINVAKTDYDNAVSENVMQQAGEQAQTGIDSPFDAAAATTKAKQKVGSFTDYLYKTAMPGIIDKMVEGGDINGAEVMRKWADDGKERAFMADFGKTLGAWNASKASGDYSPFADSAVKLLNSGNYGMTATGYDLVKDSDGKTTGMTFKLKDQDGKEFTHTFNSMDDAAGFIAGQGAPQTRVKQWMAQQDQANKFKATVATKQAEAQIGLNSKLTEEQLKQRGRERLIEMKGDQSMREIAASKKDAVNKEQATNDYVMGLLNSRGFDDDQLNQYLTQKYLGGYRKAKSPQEFAQQLVMEFAKDPMLDKDDTSKLLERARAFADVAFKVGQSAEKAAPAGKPAGKPAAPAQSSNFPVYR